MTGFTASAFLSRNRVSLKEAFEGLELCERKLSCTVLRGLDGSNPVRLLGDSLIVVRLFQGLETLLIGQEQVTALLKNTGTSSPSGDVALKERRELFGSWREFSASISDLVKVQGHHRID